MVTGLKRCLTMTLLLAPMCRGQSVQFLAEIDAHLKRNSTFRAYFEAKDDRDVGDPKQLGIGPRIQLYLKPTLKLKDATTFDLDDSKSAGHIAPLPTELSLQYQPLDSNGHATVQHGAC
jgi:hypothetical protein